MQVLLDASTRIFRAAAPDGTPLLDPSLTLSSVDLIVSDEDWNTIYYPAWSAAHAAGQDLVIDVFGGTSLVTHTPTLREQAISTLLTFPLSGTPALAQADDAIRAIIVLLELSGQLSGTVIPLVTLSAPPIRQSLQHKTRARPRSIRVAPVVDVAQRPAVFRVGVRKPPLQHRRGRPN